MKQIFSTVGLVVISVLCWTIYFSSELLGVVRGHGWNVNIRDGPWDVLLPALILVGAFYVNQRFRGFLVVQLVLSALFFLTIAFAKHPWESEVKLLDFFVFASLLFGYISFCWIMAFGFRWLKQAIFAALVSIKLINDTNNTNDKANTKDSLNNPSNSRGLS